MLFRFTAPCLVSGKVLCFTALLITAILTHAKMVVNAATQEATLYATALGLDSMAIDVKSMTTSAQWLLPMESPCVVPEHVSIPSEVITAIAPAPIIQELIVEFRSIIANQ